MQIRAGERPPERPRGHLVAVLKGHQIVLQCGQGREVVRCEDLALHDREVDFDLVQPAGVPRRVDRHQHGPAIPQSGVAFGTAMGRAVVHHPQDAARRAVRFLIHDLFDEAVEGGNAAPRLASPKEASTVDVPRRQIRPRPAPTIFVLDAHGVPRRNGGRRMATVPRLNAGLFIGRDHVVARPQGVSVPAALIEIQDRIGALGG